MTYRRPSLRTLVLATAVATFASLLLAVSRPLELIVDGEPVPSDVPPVQTAHDVYVPLRTLADALGAHVSIASDTIAVVRGDRSLRIRLGDVHATIDGRPLRLKRAPFRVRGRVMIALRPIARAFGVSADYDPRTAQIHVVTPGIGIAAPSPLSVRR
jgi:hypothetical protein